MKRRKENKGRNRERKIFDEKDEERKKGKLQ